MKPLFLVLFIKEKNLENAFKRVGLRKFLLLAQVSGFYNL